tara:strand:+ start:130 stop:432 length:303 start_codon:yes stop_codon:yes gene_type:complete
MSLFAEIKDGIVQRVIVADQEFINSGVVGSALNWIETGDDILNKRAGIGDTYDKKNKVFISEQPFPSWSLDSNFEWQPPTPKPEGVHVWNESTKAWDEIT